MRTVLAACKGAELDLAERREDVQPEQGLVLTQGGVGPVGALHPGAGVVLEGFLAPGEGRPR